MYAWRSPPCCRWILWKSMLSKAPIPSITDRRGTGGATKFCSTSFRCRLIVSLLQLKMDKSYASFQACQFAIKSAQTSNNSEILNFKTSLLLVTDCMMNLSNAEESSMQDGGGNKGAASPSWPFHSRKCINNIMRRITECKPSRRHEDFLDKGKNWKFNREK